MSLWCPLLQNQSGSLCLYTFFNFSKQFWWTSVLLVGTLMPLFWTSGDVCTVFQSHSIVCFVTYMQWIPQIHLWCDINWPLDSQHGSQVLFDPHTCTRACVQLTPQIQCGMWLAWLFSPLLNTFSSNGVSWAWAPNLLLIGALTESALRIFAFELAYGITIHLDDIWLQPSQSLNWHKCGIIHMVTDDFDWYGYFHLTLRRSITYKSFSWFDFMI